MVDEKSDSSGDSYDDENTELEKEVSQALEEGQFITNDPEQEARKRISPRYEIRTQAKMDPIVEETRFIRTISREIDDRYDKYLSRIPKDDTKRDDLKEEGK